MAANSRLKNHGMKSFQNFDIYFSIPWVYYLKGWLRYRSIMSKHMIPNSWVRWTWEGSTSTKRVTTMLTHPHPKPSHRLSYVNVITDIALIFVDDTGPKIWRYAILKMEKWAYPIVSAESKMQSDLWIEFSYQLSELIFEVYADKTMKIKREKQVSSWYSSDQNGTNQFIDCSRQIFKEKIVRIPIFWE